MKQKTYNHLNDFYKEKFGERVLKIPLDGGFTCPNRDGTKGFGGCIFCSNRGAGDRLVPVPVQDQISTFFASFKAQKANKFLAYFQNYSSTYKPAGELRKIYDSALSDERIIGLDIATRCDCIYKEVCELLAEYNEKYFVQIELGLQTSSEETHKITNQRITNNDFKNAMKLLNKYGIYTVIHLMVGLPGENHENISKTLSFLGYFDYQGIKIHSTFVEKNTVLNELYQDGKYSPITYENYMEELIYILTHISPNVIVHRISGDPYLPNFVAPEWMAHKKRVLNHVEELMNNRGLKQGIYFKID